MTPKTTRFVVFSVGTTPKPIVLMQERSQCPVFKHFVVEASRVTARGRHIYIYIYMYAAFARFFLLGKGGEGRCLEAQRD